MAWGRVSNRAIGILLSVLLAFSALPAYAAEGLVDAPDPEESNEAQNPSQEPSDTPGANEDANAGGEEGGNTEPSDPIEPGQLPSGGTTPPEEPGDSDDETSTTLESPLEEPLLQKGEETDEPEPCPLAPGVYAIMPASSSARVLDVSGGSSADGANVQVWTSNSTQAQRFEARVDDEGWLSLINAGSGKALDIAWGAAEPGANVQQYAANGTAAQRWKVVENGDGTYTLTSALSKELVLDIEGAGDFDGANLHVWTANGTAAQRFSFLPSQPAVQGGRTVDDGVYTIKSAAAPGKVLDIASAGLGDGATAQLWTSNATLAQVFSVTLEADGFYSVKAVHSGKALDADRGDIVPGARVQQWSWAGSDNQKWAITEDANGTFMLICKASGLVLDAKWGGTADGTPLQTWSSNGTAPQAWMLEKVVTLLPEGIYDVRTGLASHRSLDVANGSAAGGANVQTWTGNGSPAQKYLVSAADENGAFTMEALCSGLLLTQSGSNVVQASPDASEPLAQRWIATPSAAGGITLVNAGSGLALDVSGAGDWDGCNVGVYQVNGTAAQVFQPAKTDPIGNGTYLLRSQADGRVLDVSGGSRVNGANVQLWTANDSGAQKWNVRGVGGGWYVVENARSKKALDVAEYSTQPGANVQQWDYAGSDNQKWRIEYAGGGTYTLTTACGGQCLDEAYGGGWDGANAQAYTPNGSPAQSFRLEPTVYVPPQTGAVKRGDGSWDWYNDDGDLDRNQAINRIISTARSLLGVPYVWLGRYPQDGGMDCASFTWHLYQQLGIDIGFETYDQMYSGYSVGSSLSAAEPGDIILMYYGSWPNYNPFLPEHVVLYAGNGMIYEEPTFGGHCQFVPLASKGAGGNIDIRRIIN